MPGSLGSGSVVRWWGLLWQLCLDRDQGWERAGMILFLILFLFLGGRVWGVFQCWCPVVMSLLLCIVVVVVLVPVCGSWLGAGVGVVSLVLVFTWWGGVLSLTTGDCVCI